MKNYKVFKFGFVIVLLLISIACFVTSIKFINNASPLVLAEKVAVTDQRIADEYNISQEVDFPTEIELTHKGQTVTASDGVVFFPDGTTVYAGALKLDKLGDYYVRYYFVDADGNRCVAEKKFTVTNKLYSVSTLNGSVTAVSEEQQKDKVFGGNAEDVTLDKKDGLIVRLSEGDTFNFTTSIDLTDVGEDGLCDIMTLDYRHANFVPNPLYDTETTDSWKKLMVQNNIATYCVIRLSDSYDLGNYVELYCRLNPPINDSVDINTNGTKANYYPSFSACAVGQDRTALTPEIAKEYATYYNVVLDGQTYGLYKKNETGGRTFSNIPMTGDHTPFTWKYDYKNNKIYIQQGQKVEIVSALSSSEIYGTDTFDGFSGGKVKLSVFMTDYVSGDQGRIDISSIGSYSGKELVDNFNKLGFVDTVALPVIDLGIEDTDDRGIYAPLGKEFTLPVPKITSSESIVSSTVYAYVNYGAENQTDVPILNGKININKNRRYTVEYVVKNAAGCVSTKMLAINPVDVDKAIAFTTDYDGITNIPAGKEIVLPEYQLQTINKAEDLDVKITAVHQDQTVEIDKTSRKFLPLYSGEYKIAYECSDNVYTITYEYSVNCQSSDNIAFVGDFVLPRYFIKDAKYTLKAVPAYSFENASPSALEVKGYVSYDNGANYTAIQNLGSVKITGDSTAIIKYTCTKGGKTIDIVSDPVTIVDVGYSVKKGLRLRDYFVHDGFESKSYEETKSPDVRYDHLSKKGEGTLKFVNALDYTSLSFAFKVPENSANYKQIDVILTDYYDASITYTVSYINNNGVCYVSLNGAKPLSSGYKFEDDIVTKKINFNHLNKILTVNDVQVKDVDLSAVFTSSLCYLDVVVKDIKGDASIIVDAVNAQNFRNNRSEDNVVPLISLEDFSGEYQVGSIITLAPPCVTDVLSPVIDSEVSIYVEKDGQVLSSLDGVKLDGYSDVMREYQIKLESYGQYTISYTFQDGAGKITSKVCFVAVVDFTAPTIKLENKSNISVPLGKVLNLKYKVEDDLTSKEDIVVTIFMRDVNTNAFYTFNENKIPFHYAGEYEVFIYAKDARGNYSYKTISVTVG